MCTLTAIAKCVHALGAPEVYTVTSQEAVGVRELRLHLKPYVEGDSAVIIGNTRHIRAILVPMDAHYWDSAKKKRRVRATAKRIFTEALARALPLP